MVSVDLPDRETAFGVLRLSRLFRCAPSLWAGRCPDAQAVGSSTILMHPSFLSRNIS